MATRIKLRSDTAANWAAANPILAEGEIGLVIEGDLRRAKVGDGATAWNALDWAFEEAGGGGGATAFADLTDKASADLPAINSPLASALEAKANLAGGNSMTGNQSLEGLTTAGPVTLGYGGSSDPLIFNHLSYVYGSGSASAAHRIALGAGTTGDALFQAATAEAARDAVRTSVVLDADVLSTSATFAATGLSLTLTAGVEYLLRGSLDLVPGSSTSGAKLQLTTSQAIVCVQANGCAVGLVMQSGSVPSSIGLLTTSRSDFFSYTGATLYRRVLIELRLKLVATGTVSINFAQVAAEATASRVKAGAYLTSEIL